MGPTRGDSRTRGAKARRSSTRARTRTAKRRGRALLALALAAVAGAGLAAGLPLPGPVIEDMPALAAPRGPLAQTWEGLAALVPGTRATGWSVLVTSLTLAMGAASGWLGFQLFRGPGRIFATFSAAVAATAALASWVRATTLADQLPALAFGVFALLAVTALVRPLVHLGRVTPVAFARALAAAGAGAVLLPSAGFGLLAFCATTYVLRGRRLADLRGAPAHASLSRATMSGSVTIIVAAALAVPLSGALVLWTHHVDPGRIGTWLEELHLAAPPIDRLRAHVHPYLIYPALTLVLLLVVPLRWRGGVTLLTLFAAALLVADASGPLATEPVLLCGLAVAASGWIWLAGTVTGRVNVGRGLAVFASGGLLALQMPDAWVAEPAARDRATTSPTRVVIEAAAEPGDVVVAHEPALFREWKAWRLHEGVRPDLVVVPAAGQSEAALATLVDAARAGRPRLLSDAFDLGGLADPNDAIEVGPLYWFTFDPALTQSREAVELPEPPDGSPAASHARWTRMQLERARFRRATGRDADAVLALPLGDQRRSLRTAIRVSQAINLPAPPRSELGRVGEVDDYAPQAPVLAETGDLLFRAGEHALGLAKLTEAARMDYPPAWRALARWQLEVGHAEAAEELRDLMVVDPKLRDPVIDVIWWLVWKRRLALALDWRDRLDLRAASDPTAELAVRLALLTASATPPEPDGETRSEDPTSPP